ncbi:MAG: hypothetical protein WCT08_03735 [Patescibacteria group bacterium]
MTKDKLLKIIELYKTLLSDYPTKELASYEVHPQTDEEFLVHLNWMLDRMREQVTQGKLEKAFRWLGFIQGVLSAKGIRTIAQLREDSRSE